MSGGHRLRALLIPAILAVATSFALVAALVSDGPLEALSVALLAGVIGLIIFRLRPSHRRGGARRHRPTKRDLQ